MSPAGAEIIDLIAALSDAIWTLYFNMSKIVTSTDGTVASFADFDGEKLRVHLDKILMLTSSIHAKIVCFKPILIETPTQLIDEALKGFLMILHWEGMTWLTEDRTSQSISVTNNLMIAINQTMAREAGLRPQGSSPESS